MLLDLLRKVYDFDMTVALETIATMPSSFLYKKISPFIKKQYPNNYKFIFLNNSDVNQEVLLHVIQTIELCKIPNAFVLVITNQTRVHDFFASNNIKVKKNNIPDELETGNYTPTFNVQEKLCPYPWAGTTHHHSPPPSPRTTMYQSPASSEDYCVVGEVPAGLVFVVLGLGVLIDAMRRLCLYARRKVYVGDHTHHTAQPHHIVDRNQVQAPPPVRS